MRYGPVTFTSAAPFILQACQSPIAKMTVRFMNAIPTRTGTGINEPAHENGGRQHSGMEGPFGHAQS